LKISFSTTENRFSQKNLRKRKEWLLRCIQEEGFSISFIQFIFCSDEYLLNINQVFLKHDYYTDIITFSEAASGFLNGEIYISIERVQDNAIKFQVPFDVELNRVLIHGVLHLMNYQDLTRREKSVMTAKENYYLAKF
jgi:probable rRNA maturation factor